jgi:hypothetical protein
MFLLILSFVVGLVSDVCGQSCPEPYGIQTYPHETYCDKFHLVRFCLIKKMKIVFFNCNL